jgi:hypothetical protein
MRPFFDGIRILGYAVNVYSIIAENKIKAYYTVCILHTMYLHEYTNIVFKINFCKDLIKLDGLCRHCRVLDYFSIELLCTVCLFRSVLIVKKQVYF